MLTHIGQILVGFGGRCWKKKIDQCCEWTPESNFVHDCILVVYAKLGRKKAAKEGGRADGRADGEILKRKLTKRDSRSRLSPQGGQKKRKNTKQNKKLLGGLGGKFRMSAAEVDQNLADIGQHVPTCHQH